MNKKNKKVSIKYNIKYKTCIAISIIIFTLLLLRIAWLQFVNGASLKEKAYQQQTTNRTIQAERGNIYDSTGKVLATSIFTDTISVNPSNIKYSDGTEVSKDFLASYFSQTFNLDYNETMQKLSSDSSSVTIAKKVEKSVVDNFKIWIKENKISLGITITENISRYYPYETLASSLIGFVGTDNQGLMGLECSLDDTLSGTSGSIVTSIDSINGEIPNSEQTYIPAENGSDVKLTIDVNIQSIAEKYLEQAILDNKADGGNVIIMNPTNGDVLAMANCPNYNLNTPFIPIDSSTLENWDSLSDAEQSSYLYKLWNNRAVQTTYEPGSTFKLITTAAALEENIVSNIDEVLFSCTGYETVLDRNIACWRNYNPHGVQTLKQALANSCNPAFIQLGKMIGPSTLYKYYEAFGLFEKTNSDFYGESNSVFFDLNNVREVELATISFGQRFEITPIQLITAIASIANEGTLMKPKIVKEIANTNNGSVEIADSTKVRQVLSKKTAETIMGMMEYVVTDGTGKYAGVNGYSIGGKSGTSEPIPSREEEGYVASFIAVSPTSNAQIVILVTVYNPTGDSYQGGQVAGPVVSQILSEVLPYLGITSDNNNEESTIYSTISLTDVRGKTIAEAKEVLSSVGFNIIVNGESSEIITDQVPKPGVSLIKNSTIYLYTDSTIERKNVIVPSLKGLSLAEAINILKLNNLNIIIEGSRRCNKPRYFF